MSLTQNQSEAARRLKLARETVSRWQQNAAFQAAVAQAKREGERMAELKIMALDALKDALSGQKA